MNAIKKNSYEDGLMESIIFVAIGLLGAAVAYIFYLIRCKPRRQVLELLPGNPGGKPGENGKEIKVQVK